MNIKELLFSKDKNDVSAGLSLLGIENETGFNFHNDRVFISKINKHQDLQLQDIFKPMNVKPTFIQKNSYIQINSQNISNSYHILQ